ncbi:Outer membrane protein [Vibrio nigripulchritudo SOn1]|uniref:Outer membrane protein n=1 Tax=Vibrio nigripulchritudo SOn1 TaxID=1238450 RepID=A0AAV2VP75_9VIBR|nr:porin [Vibrio nigripulchritudo]CCO46494.1 Outer membrane protein [Vibrio nigripulchritudo SOn1]
MDKIFKRTLLGAAVSAVALSGASNAAIDLNGKAVQFYGQAAGFIEIADSGAELKDTKVNAVIESRVGFKGEVEFEDFGPNLLWQIEGGNADNQGFAADKPWTHVNNGQLGARDTFLGLSFDGVGSFKYGRQLVAAYNYVDWPHSNPGLGNVFDWNQDIGAGFQDRADNVIRFDSATFNGFNFQATLSGMESDTKDVVTSVGASFSKEKFSVHGGYYNQNEAKLSYGIVGGSVFLGDLTLTGAYKAMNNDSVKQNAISATAQYIIDSKWVLKGGYASTDDATGKKDSGDIAVTARLGYLLPSTYLFLDSRNYKMDNAKDWDNRILAGVEYYF